MPLHRAILPARSYYRTHQTVSVVKGHKCRALCHFSNDRARRLWHFLFMAKYSAAQTKAALRFLPEWTKKGSIITRTFQFRDFSTAIEFVNALARLAERANHHPDIDIRWNKV